MKGDLTIDSPSFIQYQKRGEKHEKEKRMGHLYGSLYESGKVQYFEKGVIPWVGLRLIILIRMSILPEPSSLS
ncbi:hypothetical protein [Halobacillus karajensis]|uniref:Uncharacterized protein n=1 Tax=Halobacillus karajensis TaxID=195088 RepID=A0A024P408_9BACI|nr:hypothetical protein [Halobacillus karajensis]CDQ20771.1 hypothetical protein BN982_03126 [Halobacillus karajensis]CDQ23759.1 hypothetical protein BN983_02010 [Halobacillus karajensis]CDQ27237.1 hypothetical protein BN981_01491 [Halobacillus karajensis]